MLERLQKIIARAGIASRRHAEELIKSGLVTVNGETITELGSKADESKDHIKVQGKLLRPETERVYLLLNKPPEVVSTMIDPEGRRTLSDLLYGVSQRVFPVGRLEYHSMGLVFLTNDGELANLILKAHHLPQTYELKLKTLLTFDEIESLSRATGARIARIKGKDAPWYEVTLSEARRDALRNRLFQTGHPVEKIKRVKIGNLAMESLPTGNHRPLSDGEVVTLRRSLQAGTIQNVAATEASRHENPASRAPSVSAQSITQPLAAHAGKYLAHPARRPLVKRRPFQPRIKPGQAPSKFSQSNFSRHKPYSPEFNAQRPTATGSESLQRPFDRIAGPQNLSSDGPKRFKRPFEDSRGQSRPVASGSKPSKRTSFNSQRGQPRPPASGPKTFKQRFDGPRDRSRPAESGRSDFSTKNLAPHGPKSGAPFRSSQTPRVPGAFGRSQTKFRPTGNAPSVKSGAPKRGGPGGFKPKRGRFTGPKGRS
ncbi:MAG: S4 domain-containing protein [Candidatus Acidiferrales bacterium]